MGTGITLKRSGNNWNDIRIIQQIDRVEALG